MFGFGKGHDSRAIANIFVEKACEAPGKMGIMSLVKYVYLAHGWTLGYTGRPLICHQVEAWKHGPVVPEVYHAFRGQRFVVTKKAHDYHPEFGELPPYTAKLSDEEQAIVDTVYSRYSQFGAFQLSALTHQTGTPWDQFKDQYYAPIPNSIIRDYYKGLIDAP